MLNPALPAACYTQVDWYELEKKKIFGELWLFVGFKRQLTEADSFITRDFCGVPVLVQNLCGELRAFRNTCAHRGMPLQTESFGKRKMVCAYHGWAYDSEGALRGIPNASIYGISNADCKNIGLHKFALEIVGDFIFVNLSPSHISIQEQFSPNLLRIMAAASDFFDVEMSHTVFSVDYNWKLNFENILDWNHLQFVHRNTLAPLIDIGDDGKINVAKPGESLLFCDDGDLSDINFSGGVDLNLPIQLCDVSHIGRGAMPYKAHWYSGLYKNPCDLGASFGNL